MIVVRWCFSGVSRCCNGAFGNGGCVNLVCFGVKDNVVMVWLVMLIQSLLLGFLSTATDTDTAAAAAAAAAADDDDDDDACVYRVLGDDERHHDAGCLY